jgi:hypothetical protein
MFLQVGEIDRDRLEHVSMYANMKFFLAYNCQRETFEHNAMAIS